MQNLSSFIIKRYKLVLFGALILTLFSLFLTSRLTLKTQMMDILPKDNKLVVEYKRAIENFSSVDNIIIGVTGREKDIVSYMEDVYPKLAKVDGVDKVIYKNNIEFLRKNGLLLIKKEDLGYMKEMLTAEDLAGFINGVADLFESSFTRDADTEKLEKENRKVVFLLGELREFIENLGRPPRPEGIREVIDGILYGGKYFFSTSKDMALMFIRPSIGVDDVDRVVKLVNSIESVVKKNAPTHNVSAMITGLHVITRDEMETTKKDMGLTTTLSLILILLLFYIGFHLLRYTIISFIPLIMGIIWTLGITYLLIGHLNIMTAMMAAILLGLGIDYAIHILSSFTGERRRGKTPEESIKTVFHKTIGGVITGALTTASGFYLFGLSNFPGFKEFGIVLGTGIICTVSAYIFVFPAILRVFGRKEVPVKDPHRSLALGRGIVKMRWIIIGVVILVILLSLYKIESVRFENNMLNIEAKGLESIKLSNEIKEKFHLSSDTSIAVTDTLPETRTLKEELDNLSTVGEVDSIANFLPQEERQRERMKIVNTMKNDLPKGPKDTLDPLSLSEALERLRDVIIELSDLAYMGGEKEITDACDNLVGIQGLSHPKGYVEKNLKNIEKVQKLFIGTLLSDVRESNSTIPITLSNLPPDIKTNYIGKNGKFLTIIYPKNDPWEIDFQKIYISQLKGLKKEITGSSLMYLEVIKIAAKEGKKILLWTILLIYALLVADFKSLRYATLAMLPMILAIITMLGIMGWFDIKFTVLNIMAIPLIIGIGVDDGIHLIHRYKVEGDLLSATSGVAKAITFTTLTTIAAFGTFIFAKYRGFVGLGLLLSIGVGLAYIYTLFLLPSLIFLFDSKKEV